MKKIAVISIVSIFLLTQCSPYNVDESKSGEPIDTVSNLDYSVTGGNAINITWELPSSYPDDIIQPVSVFIRTKVDGQDFGTQEINDAPTSYTYSSYDASKDYKFIIKVKGDVDTSDPNVAHVRYSLGNTVEISSSQ